MALLKCTDCAEQISSKADTCPHCGATTAHARNRRSVHWILAIIAAIAIWLIWSHHQAEKKAAEAARSYQEAIEASNKFLESQKR